MARSFQSSVKGMLSNAPMGRASSSGGASGCGGCLMVFVAFMGIVLIIEFWMPIVIVFVVALVVYVAYRVSLTLRTESRARAAGDDRVPVGSAAPRDASDVPAGWFPDPLGEHQHRYWDGSSWSDSVADNGEVSSHPL